MTPVRPIDSSTASPALAALRPHILALHATTDLKDLWNAVCNLLHAAMPPVQAMGLSMSMDNGHPSMVFHTIEGHGQEVWEQSYHASGLPEAERAAPGTPVFRMTDWISPEMRHAASHHFRENFLSKDALFYGISLNFWRGKKFVHLLCSMRTLDQGDFTDVEMRLLEALHDDIETALGRVVASENRHTEIHALTRSLREEHLPLIVLDWNLRPTFRNPEAVEAGRQWSHGADAAKTIKRSALPVLPEPLDAACRSLRDDILRDGQHNLKMIRNTTTRRSRLAAVGGTAPEAEIIYSKPANVPVDQGRFIVRFAAFAARRSDEPPAPLHRLTVSEQAVAELVAEGRSNSEVASDLSLSVHTVRSHLRTIFKKMGVQSRVQLANRLHSRSSR